MSIFVKARNTRVVVKRDEKATKVGSIFLPDTAQDKPQKGTVLAVGPRMTRDLCVGDAVLITKFAGDAFTVDGEDILIVDQKDIIAVVTDTAINDFGDVALYDPEEA
jgi:chaperonin GroES